MKGLVLVHMCEESVSRRGEEFELQLRKRIETALSEGGVYFLPWKGFSDSKVVLQYGRKIIEIKEPTITDPGVFNYYAQFFLGKHHLIRDGVDSVDLCGFSIAICVHEMDLLLRGKRSRNTLYKNIGDYYGLDEATYRGIMGRIIPVEIIKDLTNAIR